MSDVEQTTQQDVAEQADSKPRSVETSLYALTSAEAFELRYWWQRLTLAPGVLKALTDVPVLPRGVRATLRRCDRIESVMLTDAFRHLWSSLDARVWQQASNDQWLAPREQRLEAWATIAAVVSELRHEQFDAPLGQRLGQNRPNTVDTPRMSDLRFQQLLDCRTSEELIRRFRRALKLAGHEDISVVCLADMVMLWYREQHGHYRAKPTRRFAFVMSDTYFRARSPSAAASR